MRIPFKIDYDLADGSGFELTVGTARIRLMLDADGWHVGVASPPDLHTQTGLPIDPVAIREAILERMVAQGLEDLYNDRVPPGPEW